MDNEKTGNDQEQDEIPAELTASYSEISFNSNVDKFQEMEIANKIKRPDSLTCDKKKGGKLIKTINAISTGMRYITQVK